MNMGIDSREKANDRLSHLFISHITYPYLPASISLTTTVPHPPTLPYHTIPHHRHYGNRTVTEIHPSVSRSL